MGKCESDVESDEVDERYVAEWGYEHRFTVRFDHVFHVPFKLSRTSTPFEFSQESTSSSVLTTLNICQHYAKSFVSITKSQNMWIGFFPDYDALDEKRNYSMWFQFVSQPDICDAIVSWVGYERGARRLVTAKIYICQSSYITKVRRLMIHSFPKYVQRGHMQAYRTCRVTQ